MLTAEPEATDQLLRMCDRMPFAIKQLGVVLSRRVGEPRAVAEVLAEFREIAGDEGVIYECLERTFAGLAAATVDNLLILARHPGESFTYRTAGAMLGRSGRRTVDELIDAGLIEQQRGRLRLHQLVRQHADRLGEERRVDDGPYFDRLLTFYRDLALAADAQTGERLRPHPVPDGLVWSPSDVDPIGWLDVESGAIFELVKQASLRGKHLEAVQLCAALEVLLNNRYGYEWRCAEAFDWGTRSADALGEPAVRARRYAMSGRVYTLLHLFDRATAALDTAASLAAGLTYPRLESSILEFQGRMHEENATHDYVVAEEYLRRAVEIDRREGLTRPLRLHRRMLANILVKSDQPSEALALLDEAVGPSGESRNDARDHMVLAKAYTELGDLARARVELVGARALLRQAGATRYELELADIEAEIAFRAGEFEVARAQWGWVADRYCDWGHPKLNVYLDKLNQLPPPQ
jgi:tetratricopeptide (TPR) repeat protein